MHYFKSIALIGVLLALTSSCGHVPATQEFPATASPQKELEIFEADVKLAKEEQVDVLAPANFKKTRSYLKDAKKSMDKQKDAKHTLKIIAQGKAYLKVSNNFAKLAKSNLKEVIAARDQALDANADEILSSDFKDLEENLRDVTADIEKNKLSSSVKEKSSLQIGYLDLELRAIKHTNIDESKNIIKQAVKEGAEEYAPRSLAIAEKNVLDLDGFITANRHDKSQISKRSQKSKMTSTHLLKITRSSKKGSKQTSEDMALNMDGEQRKVADKKKELFRGEMANQALSRRNQDLESNEQFAQSFELARAEFSKGEAEVYQKGNALIIRLKELQFPSAKSTLQGSNFALLAKVQNVINSFDHESVIVEGHTDSVGGKEVNQQLSNDRARAVSEYFVANSNGQPLNIKSIGYDYQKPIATNKTPQGRAMNRRVDILINAHNE